MENGYIRQARPEDAGRLAEIEVFNYRLNFYPIFRNDPYYFDELQVMNLAQEHLLRPLSFEQIFVYDDGVIKGFIKIDGQEVKKLFVEPVFQSHGIGAALLGFAAAQYDVRRLWALEKNSRAIEFYARYGFRVTAERKPVDDTAEYLIRLVRD